MNIENLDTESGILQSGNTEVSILFIVDQQTSVEINGFSNSLSSSGEGVGFRLGNDSNNNGVLDNSEVIEASLLPVGGITDPRATFEGNLDPGNYLIELSSQGTSGNLGTTIENLAFQVEYNLDISSTPLESTNVDTINESDSDSDTSANAETDTEDLDSNTDTNSETEDLDSDSDLQGGDDSNTSDIETIDLTDSNDQSINFTVTREAGFDNTVDFYPVDADGNVTDFDGNIIAPGEDGYADIAIANRLGADISTDNGVTSQFTVEFSGGTSYAPLLAVDSDFSPFADSDDSNDPVVYFTYPDANIDGFDHVIGSDIRLAFEDLPDGGDEDFNDIVLDFELVADEPDEEPEAPIDETPEEEPETEEPVDETPVEEPVIEEPVTEEPEGDGSISGTKFLNISEDFDSDLIQGNNPNIVFAIDISGSTDRPFVGSPVGDLNDDDFENTFLDGEIAGFLALRQQLIDLGQGDINIGVIPFDDEVDMVIQTTADSPDLVNALTSLNPQVGTNFEAPLQEAEAIFDSLPGNGNLIFISDGGNTGFTEFSDEVERLNALDVNISAFGVGENSSLDDLQTIDPDAIQFTSTDQLLNVFGDISSNTDDASDGEESQSTIQEVQPGVTIYIDLDGDGTLDDNEPSQVTDENGEYIFEGLAAGTYTLREVVPDGFTSTTGEVTITLGEGEAVENINFVNVSDEELAMLSAEPDM